MGEYSTPVTSEGYAVMSTDPGSLYSVQVYPVGALEADYRPDETRWLVPPLYHGDRAIVEGPTTDHRSPP